MKINNWILVRNLLVAIIATSFVFVGCKKDKTDSDSLDTKLTITGDVSFDLPSFALVGDKIKVEASGVTKPTTGVTYKWFVKGITKDTIKAISAEFIIPDSLATYSVSLSISAEGYYNKYLNKTVMALNPNRGGSLTGIVPSKDSILDDRDNRWYYTVKIGDLEWFAENLKWDGAGEGYQKSNAAGEVLGRLYTWNDATNGKSSSGLGTGVQGVCPKGWSIPTNEDWENLANAVGGGTYNFVGEWDGIGAKLMANAKLNGTSIWNYSGNFSSSNEFGWNAISSGMCSNRYTDFKNLFSYGFWWSATQKDEENANYRYIFYNYGSFPLNYVSKDGFGASVRCVRKTNK